MTMTVRHLGFIFVTYFIGSWMIGSPAYPETFTLDLKTISLLARDDIHAASDPFFLYRGGMSQGFHMERDGIVRGRSEVNFPEVIQKEPLAYQSGRPFRCVAKLGEDSYGFVLDTTDVYMEGYPLLYFDINHNGDLTDDPVVRAIPLSEGERSSMPAPVTKRPWGPEQATGAPDTLDAGDSEAAWSPKARDGGMEWLLLRYEIPLKARGIKVYETYSPGALAKVCILDSSGTETEVWSGKDPLSPEEKMGVSEVSFDTPNPTDQLKIYIDSKSTPGWNEIDTVGLVDASGETHWPVYAEASSFYSRSFMSDPPIEQPRYQRRSFQPMSVRIRSGSEEIDYIFHLTASSYHHRMGNIDNSYTSASLQPAVFREGEVATEGKRHKFVLLDFNSNGRFDDLFTIPEREGFDLRNTFYPKYGDMILVDPRLEDREYSWGVHARAEWQYLSKLLRVEGHYYAISVSPSGSTVSLEASKLPTGSIKNPNPFSAVVFGEQGLVKVTGATSEAVAIPAGDWRLLSYRIDRTPPSDMKLLNQGGRYQTRNRTYVEANGTAAGPVTHVTAENAVLLPFGPPYHPVVKREEGFYSDTMDVRKESLVLSLVGSASEVCSSMHVCGSNPPEPTFSIATTSGEIVQRGSFEYG